MLFNVFQHFNSVCSYGAYPISHHTLKVGYHGTSGPSNYLEKLTYSWGFSLVNLASRELELMQKVLAMYFVKEFTFWTTVFYSLVIRLLLLVHSILLLYFCIPRSVSFYITDSLLNSSFLTIFNPPFILCLVWLWCQVKMDVSDTHWSA